MQSTTLPPGFYSGIAWIEKGTLIVGHGPPSASADDFELKRVDVADRSLDRLNVRALGSRCRYVGELHPAMLPSGDLGYVEACGRRGGDVFRLVEHSLKSGTTRGLAKLPFAPARYSWSSDQTQAFISNSDELCGGIAAWTQSGPVSLNVSVGEGDQSFRLSDAFSDAADGQCSDTGLADWPAASPTDGRLAFVASPEAIGLEGFEKAEAMWNLYIVDIGRSRARAVVEGLRHPRGLTWNPADNLVAFSAEVDDEGSGTFVYDLDNEELHVASSASAEWLAWDPSGQHLVLLDTTTDLRAQLNIVMGVRGVMRSAP